jgi:DNA replication and repair protein RecF
VTAPAGRLHLSALRLAEFRSHRAMRLDLDGRPVVLFGPNGAGKTNVLEAVSLLSPGRGLRRAAPDELSRAPGTAGWKVAAGLVAPGGRHEIETWAAPGEARQLRIDGKPAAQTALARLCPLLWLTPAMDRLWTDAAEGRRRFLDRMTLSFLPEHGEAALAYDKAMRERNRLLREGVADPAWHAALEAQMARAGAAITVGRTRTVARLMQAQEGAATAFPAAALALTLPAGAETPADPAGLAAALAAGRRRDLAAGRTLAGPHRADLAAIWADRGMPAAQCSTGEQKALLLSLVLANARALAADAGAPPILLLDEVAAHLDTGRRAALYAEIVALGAQAFLTGTGPELFAGLGARAQGFAVTDSAGVSVLSEEPLP